ncbi:hypothetical protein BRADI_3g56083v3 [Brachypodium distachyon]|uniref:Uncharacterized protein n=1 Tax=Brachypodium distachyon TaxID=15368 RepID=A0A0Q3IML0_BRADI|nr:hypothetical protein BRADI_3g56083v3 [Brachypodium distachyon]KQK01476.1 hypothetical protein BRADI_3g56083v3 [Brachypodium distachyon]
MMNSLLSLGSPEAVSSPRKVEYIHSCACIPYIADAYYGGVLTVYVSHASIYFWPEQMMAWCMVGSCSLWQSAWCQIRTLNLKYHKNKSKSFEFWMFVFPQISIYEYSNYFGGYFGQQLITW